MMHDGLKYLQRPKQDGESTWNKDIELTQIAKNTCSDITKKRINLPSELEI